MQRVILISGGTSGIGLATAKRFASLGDEVIVWGRDKDRVDSADKVKGVTAVSIDASDPMAVEAGIRNLIKDKGKIDVLVSAVGSTGPFTTETPYNEAIEVWDKLIANNLTSSFLVTQAAAQYLTRNGGRVVMVGSISAFSGSVLPGGIGYAAAKAGLNGLTMALARELGPKGITVNLVAPGFIEQTGITAGMDNETHSYLSSQSTVGRAGKVDDVANAIVYLASPEASFVNAEIHHVNGGWLPGR